MMSAIESPQSLNGSAVESSSTALVDNPDDFRDDVQALMEIGEGHLSTTNYSKLSHLTYSISQMGLKATFELAEKLPSEVRQDDETYGRIAERCIWHRRNMLLVEEVEEKKAHSGLSKTASIDEVIRSWRDELEEAGYSSHQIREKIPAANTAKSRYRIGCFVKWLGFDGLWEFIELSSTYFHKLLLASGEAGFSYEDWVELLRRTMQEGWRPSQLEDYINSLKDDGGSLYICEEVIQEVQTTNRTEWQKLTDQLAYPEDSPLSDQEQLQRVRGARNELMTWSEKVFQRMDDALEQKEQQLKARLEV